MYNYPPQPPQPPVNPYRGHPQSATGAGFPQPPTAGPSPEQLAQEKAQLDLWRQQLSAVHSELKQQNDMLTALKEMGVNSVEDVKTLQGQPAGGEQAPQAPALQTEPQPAQTDNLLQTQTEPQATNEVAQLKQQIQELKQSFVKVSNENYIRNTRDQIKEMVKDNPDYEFLGRMVDEKTTTEILQHMINYKNKFGKALDLKTAVNYAEQNLRALSERMHGKPLDKKPLVPTVGDKTSVPDLSVLNKSPTEQVLDKAPPVTQLPASGAYGGDKPEDKQITATGYVDRAKEADSVMAEMGIV